VSYSSLVTDKDQKQKRQGYHQQTPKQRITKRFNAKFIKVLMMISSQFVTKLCIFKSVMTIGVRERVREGSLFGGGSNIKRMWIRARGVVLEKIFGGQIYRSQWRANNGRILHNAIAKNRLSQTPFLQPKTVGINTQILSLCSNILPNLRVSGSCWHDATDYHSDQGYNQLIFFEAKWL